MKRLFLIIILLVSTPMVFAQSFSFGPKAGLNLSNYTGGDFDTDASLGYHLGGQVNFGFSSLVSLQLEAMFSTQGAKIKKENFKQKIKTDYITIPVLLQLKAKNGFFVELGPQIGFRTNDDIPNQTIKNFSKNMDLSLAGGLGYKLSIGLGVNVRYVAGLSKVGDFSSSNINPDFKNSVIQASVFWAIPLGR